MIMVLLKKYYIFTFNPVIPMSHDRNSCCCLKIFVDLFLVIILVVLIAYFIVPRYVMNRSSMTEKCEEMLNSSLKDFKISFDRLTWNSLADIMAQGININYDQETGPSAKVRVRKAHVLLPPEAIFSTHLLFSEDNILYTQFTSEGIFASLNSLRIFNASIQGHTFANIASKEHDLDPFSWPFQATFSIEKVVSGSNELTEISGFLRNHPHQNLIGKGRFLWKGYPFVFVIKANPEQSDIYLTGSRINIENFVTEKIITSGLFHAQMHIQIKGTGIEYFSADFVPEQSGILHKFDYYEFVKMVPQDEMRPIYTALDAFQHYPYDTGLISFEWKNSDFIMDFHFRGQNSQFEPHLIIPVHNVKEAYKIMQINIFPVFFKELHSIIPYLKKKGV